MDWRWLDVVELILMSQCLSDPDHLRESGRVVMNWLSCPDYGAMSWRARICTHRLGHSESATWLPRGGCGRKRKREVGRNWGGRQEFIDLRARSVHACSFPFSGRKLVGASEGFHALCRVVHAGSQRCGGVVRSGMRSRGCGPNPAGSAVLGTRDLAQLPISPSYNFVSGMPSSQNSSV